VNAIATVLLAVTISMMVATWLLLRGRRHTSRPATPAREAKTAIPRVGVEPESAQA
jgi:hypothetical protein